jgi:flagellar hook-associated protein 2
MAWSVGGLMSGLDTQSIISQLMELERKPIDLLEKRQEAFQLKISAYGEIKSALSEFQSSVKALSDPSTFGVTAPTSSDEEILTVSSSSNASPGSHTILVKSLAKAHAVRSAAFSSADEMVGTGTLTIRIGGGDPVDIEIDAGHATLSGIAQAIENADVGVSASVVDNGNGEFYLALMSNETGTANTISVSVTDSSTGQLSSILESGTMVTTLEAADSLLTFNGIEVRRSSNTIDDLVRGVTIQLLKAEEAQPVTVGVTRDTGAVTEKINAFVEAYNKVVDEFRDKQSYGGEAGSSGALIGDGSARAIQRRFRTILGSRIDQAEGAYTTLASIGISMDRYGKLEVDEDKLAESINDNVDDVITLFTTDSDTSQGIATALEGYLDTTLDSRDGVLAVKEKGLQDSIDGLKEKQEIMEARLTLREENLWKQFNALEQLLGTYQQTSTYLSQQISGLENLNKQIGGN